MSWSTNHQAIHSTYYFNEVQNITQWESPEAVEDVAATDAPEDPVEAADVHVSSEADKALAEIVAAPVVAAEKDDQSIVETALPVGWVELSW